MKHPICDMEILALVRVLVDTSVWIEFFRKNDPFYSVVSQMIDDEQICCLGIILAELMQGAKSDKELAVLNDFSKVFEFIPETQNLWADAGRLSFDLRRKGITIGLADCYIAVAAAQANAMIATCDIHFKMLEKSVKISLYVFE